MLVGVLLRFRQHPVAVMTDIKSIFYQVWMPPHEHDVPRCLRWTNGDLTQQPSVNRMCIHLFGGTCSQSACSFALRRTADEKSAEAVQAVKRKFYSQLCLSRIHWDWRNSFDLEKIRLMWGQKIIENKEKRTWIGLWLRRLFDFCDFDLGRVDCMWMIANSLQRMNKQSNWLQSQETWLKEVAFS